MSAGAPVLSVARLGLRRGEEWLFRGLDFDLGAGELLWLRAANGRGKTSLLRVLAGLGRQEEGTLRWRDAAAPLYIGHACALKDDLTAQEALAFLARLHGHSGDAAAIRSALRFLGVHHRRDRPVRSLSQGQRRRVALARLALQQGAGAWLLDEPFDALDAEGSAIIGALLAEHLGRGGSVLLTSHLPLRVPGFRPRELDLGALGRA